MLRRLLHTIVFWGGLLASAAAWAQAPVAQSYATRDGRAATFVLACVSTDGTFSAQPCGVAGYPVHVVVDGGNASGAATGTPTTAPGAASAQLVGVQGGGANALPVSVTAPDVRTGAQSLPLNTAGNAVSLALNGQATLGLSFAGVSGSNATLLISGSGDGGVTYSNLPAYFPSNPAQYAINLYVVGNTGAQVPTAGLTNVRISVYVAGTGTAVITPSAAAGASVVAVANLPATQAVSGTVNVGTLPAAARSGAWTDASAIITTTAAVPPALASATARTGLHVWNLGTSTVCLNYTAAAATSGSGCAAGSVPIAPGAAYLEDQPGNVSPEAISLVCAGASCPLTIKVR